MTTVAQPPKKGYRTIRLPLAESEYGRFLTDRSYAKDRLEELYEECAAWFPEAFPRGYACFGSTEPSMKQQLLCRRMRLEHGRTVCTIAPAFVMPYMTGRLFGNFSPLRAAGFRGGQTRESCLVGGVPAHVQKIGVAYTLAEV